MLINRPQPVGFVASVVPGTSSTAIHSGLPAHRGPAHPLAMGSKSRETIYGASIRAAEERATEARKLITHQTEVLVHDAHNLHCYVGLNTHVVSVFLKLP
jgi:hypothetical protein